jgi:hypothetical protein
VTPTRLREIAQQLENNCSAYQEKITRFGYLPCQTCRAMAGELRAFAANDMKPGPMPVPQRTSEPEEVETVGGQ